MNRRVTLRGVLLGALCAAAWGMPAGVQQAGAQQTGAQHGGIQQADGLLTRPSAYSLRVTVDRFAAAVRAANWVVFAEIDHAAAAGAVNMVLPGRIVVLFGNPRAGTPAMQAHPTLALDLPMRALVWEDAQGRVHLTRSSGADIAARVFARHGVTVPADGQAATDSLLEDFARQATE